MLDWCSSDCTIEGVWVIKAFLKDKLKIILIKLALFVPCNPFTLKFKIFWLTRDLPAWVFQGDRYFELATLMFPWWCVIACHVTQHNHNTALNEWGSAFMSFFLFYKKYSQMYSMKHLYSDCQKCASGWVLLFNYLYNDRVSWAVCTMGGAILVCFTVQRIGSVGFTTSIPPLLTKYMKVSGWWTGRIGSNVKLLTHCVSDMNKTCRLIIGLSLPLP